ncbi:hypothetical protein KVG29_02460 [Caldicoprobacter algeriensis]|uniref:glycoside hydrolase family 28 protein n=1 Tax=Caldicoprobacter algeriensis TaxID=699281 RepID=UPI00207AE441|nr:glycosyl hydrolase family 28 protein [Caldicoprobacter algeriensis]MCM8900084.1 hypothetical protein [Caldicoprobacter algeriensis]
MGMAIFTNTENCVEKSELYEVFVNGKELHVYRTPVSHFVLLSVNGEIEIEVKVLKKFDNFKIRPLSAGIKGYRKNNTVSFKVNMPHKLSFEIDNDLPNPLFILMNPVENIKDVDIYKEVIRFEGGKVHEIGLLELKSGQMVYIEEGAVVKGIVKAKEANNIAIMGRGILDAIGCHNFDETVHNKRRPRTVELIGCKNVFLEGITVINGPSWHIVPVGCEDVVIKNVNIITFTGTGDGIDLVGCKNVLIENCFIRSKDDCIAIKAMEYDGNYGTQIVKDICVKDCVFWNAEWGNALEIGYETRTEEIYNITFKNCDIIHCEFEGYQSGATLSIHNGDRAFIHDVLYQDIRVEDSQEKLIDLKILVAQYTRDQERGHIKNIYFKDINVVDGSFPVSIIRGFDAEHMVENVIIDNLCAFGKRISNSIDGKMVIELSRNVKFI